jgi:hypothetical protein
MARRLHEEMNGAPPRIRRGRGFRSFISHHDFCALRIWRTRMFAWKGEGVSASAFTTRIAFSKVILSRKRYEVMESKGSLGVNFSDTNHFPEFWWIFYWRANKA